MVVLALDAADARLTERWMSEGHLPTLAHLARTGAALRLRNPVSALADAIWPEVTTGRLGASIGLYWHPEQVIAGQARSRPLRADDVDLRAVWHHASDAGCRVAVIDVPVSVPAPGLHGVMLREWGTHDTPFGTATDPHGLLDEVLNRYGDNPVGHDPAARTRCDDNDDSPDFYRWLVEGLRRGAATKGRLMHDLLSREDWDLFFGAFSECHCAGHQLWHFMDETSPWHDPSAPAPLKSALRDIYAQVDDAVAHVLEAAEDAAVFVLLTHGMGPYVAGHQLLPEVLVRLGYSSGRGTASRVRGRLPAPLKRALRAAVRGSAGRRLQEAGGSLPHPLESSATRAIATSIAPQGAIRLNVKGRDPCGSIEPGGEYDAACEELATELEALENADTGTPAVEAVLRLDELYGDALHPNMPDLVVRFRREHAPILRVRSPRIGVVSGPVRTPALPRSGEHDPTTPSLLLAAGAGIEGGLRADGGHVLDLAPTLLETLGVPVPEGLAGTRLALPVLDRD